MVFHGRVKAHSSCEQEMGKCSYLHPYTLLFKRSRLKNWTIFHSTCDISRYASVSRHSCQKNTLQTLSKEREFAGISLFCLLFQDTSPGCQQNRIKSIQVFRFINSVYVNPDRFKQSCGLFFQGNILSLILKWLFSSGLILEKAALKASAGQVVVTNNCCAKLDLDQIRK